MNKKKNIHKGTYSDTALDKYLYDDCVFNRFEKRSVSVPNIPKQRLERTTQSRDTLFSSIKGTCQQLETVI